MRIEILGHDDSVTAQARAYAEYRLFSTLARYARVIRSVRVVLRQVERQKGADRVTCAVDLVLEPSGSARARAQGRHTLGAIDRAAERIGYLMKRSPLSAASGGRVTERPGPG
jgi:ribosome-associated translation inhibitor RaiA